MANEYYAGAGRSMSESWHAFAYGSFDSAGVRALLAGRSGRERGRGGAGLGLAIVAAVVDANGGSVLARNALGGGASFVVSLPAAA